MPQVVLISASGTTQRRLVEETLKQLQADGFDEVVRREEGQWNTLLADNLSAALFSQKRVLLFEGAEQLGRFPDSLFPMLEKKSDTLLLLVYGSDGKKNFSKQVQERIQIKEPPPPPKPWERERWILKRGAELGVKLTGEAASLLSERLDDLEEICSEISKLHSVAPGETIDKKRLLLLTTSDGSGNMLRFLDALCDGDLLVTLTELRLFAVNKNDFLPILTAVYNRMRLAWYAACYPNGGGALLKALGARDYAWKKAQKAHTVYGKTALLRFHTACLRMQLQARNGSGSGWYDMEFELLLLFESTSHKSK